MARIRSIKPEFPQSESMGRVSRDARLLFVMLWPICDDHGRTRAASRLLASLLFPYDTDAPGLMDGWLAELEREGCIKRYEVAGSTFLEVCNWLIHQKIDKPSKPVYPDPSGSLANPREGSWLEGKGKEGKGGEGKGDSPAKERKPKSDTTLADWIGSLDGAEAIPATDPIFAWAEKQGIPGDWLAFAWAEFEERYTGTKAENTQKDWRAAFRDHVRRGWLDIWRHDAKTNSYVLTTAGVQWQRELSA